MKTLKKRTKKETMIDAEHEKIIHAVSRASLATIKALENKGLISLYLGGTIMTEDRTPHSDIDLFGLVSSKFNLKNEQILNEFFESRRYSDLHGIEARFRAIPISAFEGGKQFGVITFFKPERFIRKMPFFKHLWGKKFDFKNDFPIKPMKEKAEALYLIGRIKEDVTELRKGTEKFPFTDFPKLVIELVRVEAIKEKGFKYDPSYKALSKHLEQEEHHIFHRAERLRHMKPTRQEVMGFSYDVEEYLVELQKRINEWK